jgi:hypothetical protein
VRMLGEETTGLEKKEHCVFVVRIPSGGNNMT